MSERPGSRFVRTMMNKALAICAAVLAASLGTASAQLTYTGGDLNTDATYDGALGGADNFHDPFTIGDANSGDYIGANGGTGSLTVLSGTLTINANDFKIGASTGHGTVTLGANATLNINQINQWGGGLGNNASASGTLVISNNATLNWLIAGSSEQRFLAADNGTATITLDGGSMNFNYGAPGLGDNDRCFAVGASGVGTINLNSGTLSNSLPIPSCLGGRYHNMNSTPTFASAGTVSEMNILNGSYVQTGIAAEVDGIKPTFTVGTGSYVAFRGGTGSLSLFGWASSDFEMLVTNGQIRVGFPGQPGVQTTMSSFNYTSNSVTGQGILTAIVPFVIPATIASQPPAAVAVIAGRTLQLTAGVGGSEPISYQWQLNGTNVNLLPDSANFTGANTNTLTILSMTANDVGSYRLIVSNSFPPAATSSVASVTLNTNAHLLGNWFTGAANLADVSGYTPAGTHDGYDATGSTSYDFTSDVPAGKSGQALRLFNGDTGIAINNSSTLDAAYTNTFDETIQNSTTVAFWAKGRPDAWNPWVSKHGDGGGWQLRVNNNIIPTWTIRGTGGTEDMGSTLGGIDTSWHAYVGIFDAATGIRSLYVDGVLAATQSGQSSMQLNTASHLAIGARDSGGNSFGNFFNGQFYDVRVYNYDLTSAEAAQYSAVPDPSIVGQPQSATAYVGGTAQMRATTRGSAPMTNQWQFNGTPLVDGFHGGAIVSGSTSSVLTISSLTTNVQGVYRLILSSPGGTTIGSNATLTVLSPATPSAANLVGAWFTGAANLADSSGYTPAGTHDGYGVTGANTPSVNYAFASDVPPGAPVGLSLSLNGSTAIVISNSSSTLDGAYVNTFDDTINADGMTVTAWAKGLPGGWNPWVSKNGEGVGWQLRVNGSGSTPCWSVRGTSGNDDMSSSGNVDSNWHFYAGTYSSGTGIRNLYVDGVLAATQSGDTGPLGTAVAQRLVIGARDNNGDDLGSYFTGKIYGVRIYKTALSESEVNSFIRPVPVFVGQPVLNGNQLVLTWAGGSLLQATNVTGPWTPTGATAPYTNITSAPQMFFKVSNP